jgi:hypothetical protein
MILLPFLMQDIILHADYRVYLIGAFLIAAADR